MSDNLNKKIVYHLDGWLKKSLAKKTNWVVLTLPGCPLTTNAVNVSLVDYLEKIYPGLGIDKIVCVFNELGEVKWLLDADEYLRKGKKNFNRRLLGKIKKDVKVVSKKYYSFIDYLKKNGLKSSRLESDFLQ
ncbi:MAG: hypothetical protein WC575_04725, partial [Patescibacteria group bacterium]